MSLHVVGPWLLALCSALAIIRSASADADQDTQRELIRAQRREAKLAKVRLIEGERARERAELLPHLLAPHILVQVGVSPVLIGRDNPDETADRFRTGSVTLGAAYRQNYRWWLGLQAGLDLGVGGSHMAYADIPAGVGGSTVTRTGAAYSSSLEVGPVFGPFRAFYFHPAAQVRALWPSQTSARLVDTAVGDEKEEVHDVHFERPLLLVGMRLGVGVVLRARSEWDLEWGVDVAHPLYDADRGIGGFLRFGRVFELPRRG